MYFYFSSSFPSVLKINGIYFGRIDANVKHIDLDVSKDAFIEVCSIHKDFASFNFILSEDFLSCPPENVSLVDLCGGYLLQFKSRYVGGELYIVDQKNLGFAIATVYKENGVKISIETKNDFFIDSIDFEVDGAKIETCNFNGQNLILIFLSGKSSVLIIYNPNDKITRVFREEVDNYVAQNSLTTESVKRDIAKHKIENTWRFNNDCFELKNRKITVKEGFLIENLPEKLLPYAFFEEILVGGNYEPYLAENLIENKDLIRNYLGDFIGVCPPPIFKNSNSIGLIYKRKENLYYVNYYSCDIFNRQITNFYKN